LRPWEQELPVGGAITQGDGDPGSCRLSGCDRGDVRTPAFALGSRHSFTYTAVDNPVCHHPDAKDMEAMI
jgi:hypothetical protein